jgi:hypothetical protein
MILVSKCSSLHTVTEKHIHSFLLRLWKNLDPDMYLAITRLWVKLQFEKIILQKPGNYEFLLL